MTGKAVQGLRTLALDPRVSKLSSDSLMREIGTLVIYPILFDSHRFDDLATVSHRTAPEKNDFYCSLTFVTNG